jgi:endonuclease/exonuclease/phosphatase family metal-dependent hydrolase
VKLVLPGLLLAMPFFSAMGEPTLTVVTYNIHHAEGLDGVVDLDRIAGILRALDPDVIFLQEIDRNLSRTSRQDFPALFSEKLGMEVFFEANYLFDNGEYGNATLTRLPVKEHENIALPNPMNVEPRGCLRVTVEWEGQLIDVMNTHLGLKGQERLAQAEAIVARMSDRPIILGGDMNENLTAPALQRFTAKLKDTLIEDADGKGNSFPAEAPRRRIDFILVSEEFEVLSSSMVINEETRVGSDHLPYVTTLRRAGAAKAEDDGEK